jgi:hypothetical protein
MHKLFAPWEGPFIVTEVISPSAYRLQWGDGQGVPILGTWNIYDDSIRRIVFNYSYVFLFLVPFLD